MKVYLATDHAGFSLKEDIKGLLLHEGHQVEDMGAHEHVPGDDYPDYITPCVKKVVEEEGSVGIVFGGSGQGEAMVANRESGARAVVYYGGSLDIVTLGREHNNANILSLGARFVTREEAEEAVRLFLLIEFSGDERHVRRIAKF
jgi:ribose 5-phosphate isomerase B